MAEPEEEDSRFDQFRARVDDERDEVDKWFQGRGGDVMAVMLAAIGIWMVVWFVRALFFG